MPGKNAMGGRDGGSHETEVIDVLTIGTESKVPSAPKLNPENVRQPRAAKPADKRGWWWGTGRRKTSVARVRLRPAEGDGASVVIMSSDKKRERPIENYFHTDRDRSDALSPLRVTSTLGRFKVVAVCHGGGLMGQAQAIRLGLARALRDYDPNLEQALRDNDMLTRDSREVERKKYGQAGARRRFQFSKR